MEAGIELKGTEVKSVRAGTFEMTLLFDYYGGLLTDRQRTCFAQAIIHDPAVLIMDEPTDGLDPNQKHTVREMIKEMSAEKAIVISTHILEEVDAVCTRALIIADGEIKADGTPARLKAMDPSGRLDIVFRNLTKGGEK